MQSKWRHRAAAGLLLALVLPTVGRADEPGRSFTIAASGDTLIHASVARAAAVYAGGRGYDFTPMLAPTEPWIAEADLAICHLEGALSTDDSGLSYYPLFIAPHTVADAIAAAGYDTCSLAGNHALDRGELGLEETIELLEERGIAHEGTARSEEERLPGFYRVNGVRVAHLDYTYSLNGLPRPAWYSVNLIDAEAILADARWAREHGAEFVIVSLHWGAEYQIAPTGEQVALAERLLASPDIDLILGTHVHVVQPIGWVADKVVVYGMGNEIANMWAYDGHTGTEDGVLVHLTVEEAGGRFVVTEVSYTPTWVDPVTKSVLPVAHTLAHGPDEYRNALRASLSRSVERVTMLDAPGLSLSPTPWPALLCGGRLATILGTSGPDSLAGTAGPDVIAARGGSDFIAAGAGDDLVCGGPGADTASGGAGRDVLRGGPGDDDLDGLEGNDRLHGEEGDDHLSGGGDDDALYGGQGADELAGGDDGDLLFADEGDDLLLGGAGDDRLYGGPGRDSLYGDDGADALLGGTGVDLLFGGAGDDALLGGGEAQGLMGGDGADTCRAGVVRDGRAG
jgi:poly-gamma-glutamate capsule biosynthesis protein CapA/YwtB (metallophosphatase superfamily)